MSKNEELLEQIDNTSDKPTRKQLIKTLYENIGIEKYYNILYKED
ncbi:hypothetical protein P5F71_07740 [Clostridium perfringens]|nr:hypothetical protein [Clostridium perfringens]